MIFGTSTQEIYWILSTLLKRYDIEIINKIMNYKKASEFIDTRDWYIEHGLSKNKLTKGNEDNNIIYNRILLNPYNENREDLRNIHKKIFHLKIIFETFLHPGFILNQGDNIYTISTLSEKIETLNYFINKYGIYEIHGKLFQCKNIFITDLIGNKCIRSIIRIKNNDTIRYEYKTIAYLDDNTYHNPVERLNTLV